MASTVLMFLIGLGNFRSIFGIFSHAHFLSCQLLHNYRFESMHAIALGALVKFAMRRERRQCGLLVIILAYCCNGFMNPTTPWKPFDCLAKLAIPLNSIPESRPFIFIHGNGPNQDNDKALRILQFNVLADGLSGSCDALGNFSRVSGDVLDWNRRKEKLLFEITQYNPDVITLQEVDHYHDYLWPMLLQRGYKGFFAPKPTSKCLEMGGNADGCAMFVRSRRLRVLSAETKTLALSKAELTDSGELNEDERNILAQNQVALIVVCDLLDDRGDLLHNSKSEIAPPIIICTTHLKSAKSPTGERYRERGIGQVLTSMEKVYHSYVMNGRTPAVILTGDFNAITSKKDYPPLTYQRVKRHPFRLQSVYNDDVEYSPVRLSCNEFYTTWKARRRGAAEDEVVVKRCIDYIFYGPYQASTIRRKSLVSWYAYPNDASSVSLRLFGQSSSNGYLESSHLSHQGSRPDNESENDRDDSVLARTSSQIAVSSILRFVVYFFGALFPLTSLISTEVQDYERWSILGMSLVSLAIFERNIEGSVFKPRVASKLESSVRSSMQTASSQASSTLTGFVSRTVEASHKEYIKRKSDVDFTPTHPPTSAPSAKKVMQENLAAALSRLRSSEDKFFSGVASFSQQLQPLQQYGRPGFRTLAVLDVFREEKLEPQLIPSSFYPSDHIAIAADLELLW